MDYDCQKAGFSGTVSPDVWRDDFLSGSVLVFSKWPESAASDCPGQPLWLAGGLSVFYGYGNQCLPLHPCIQFCSCRADCQKILLVFQPANGALAPLHMDHPDLPINDDDQTAFHRGCGLRSSSQPGSVSCYLSAARSVEAQGTIPNGENERNLTTETKYVTLKGTEVVK